MRTVLMFVAVALALPLGCGGAQQSSPAESGWSDELADPSMQPVESSESPERRSADGPMPITKPPATQPTEMRVRHDLMMAKEAPHNTNCSCLSMVVADAPTDSRLMWIDAPPKLEADVAVVAMSTKGIACPNLPAESTDRPSISGVERDGPDVVIVVENLAAGKPIASGAVIPKPGPGGSVYVKPKGPKVPYGRPLQGAATNTAKCKVR